MHLNQAGMELISRWAIRQIGSTKAWPLAEIAYDDQVEVCFWLVPRHVSRPVLSNAGGLDGVPIAVEAAAKE